MASLEEIRINHEDIEKTRKYIITLLNEKTTTKKDTILRDHKVSCALDYIKKNAENLLSLYEDKDKTRSNELSLLSGRQGEQYTSFYNRMKEIKTYHARHPDIEFEDESSFRPFAEDNLQFSAEESFGKHIDLHLIYVQYLNIPNVKRISYLVYLDVFDKFDSLPRTIKSTARYRSYIQSLLDYLQDFYRRTQPLVSWNELQAEAINGFQEAWEAGSLPGWSINPEGKDSSTSGDLSEYNNVEDLISLGGDALKEMLTARGLKCGGTIQERADRLFSIKDVPVENYPVEILAGVNKKKSKGKKEGSDTAAPAVVKSNVLSLKDIAEIEYKIASLCELLTDVINATKTFTEKKLVRSFEERRAEAKELEEAERIIAEDQAADSDDEEETIYNPLNLPLGWDGKPIPYWLYKLHGLGVSYSCEICGNATYRGRRAFDMHFQEFRHAHGMKCLGIQNSKHFHDITKIQDAIDLNAKLKIVGSIEKWDPDMQEEFEDSEGNVLNSKMYHDLARQGLL